MLLLLDNDSNDDKEEEDDGIDDDVKIDCFKEDVEDRIISAGEYISFLFSTFNVQAIPASDISRAEW
jgi:hypothetical protein